MSKSKKKSPSKNAPNKTTNKETTKKVDEKQVSKKVSLNPKEMKLPKITISEKFKPALKIIGTVILIVVSLALVDLLVQYINNDLSVAVVNGTRITRRQWHDRLEKTYGSAVASQMIEDQIIKLEAKKAGVTVSEEEIDGEINEIIESIGGEEIFESALVANNITLEELRDQIKSDLLATKILAPSLEFEDQDVMDFFDMYSDVIFPEETAALEDGEKLDFEKFREEVEEIFIQQEVQMTRSTWIQERKAEYNIQDNSTSRPRYGFLVITTNIINNLLEGDTSTTTEE